MREVKLTDKPGIYLMAQIIRNLEDNQSFYAIKVGKSSNLRKRVNSYKGMNPGCICIDIMECQDYDRREKIFQEKIIEFGGYLCAGGREWFSIPKENFDKVLEKGLNAVYNLERKYG